MTNKVIVPTSVKARAIFKEYNLKCFGGRLPICPILCVQTKGNNLGQFCYRTINGKYSQGSGEIRLNTMYAVYEHDLVNTIVHEMIHYYIHLKDIKDDSMHGKEFTRIAQRINKSWGMSISAVSNDTIYLNVRSGRK